MSQPHFKSLHVLRLAFQLTVQVSVERNLSRRSTGGEVRRGSWSGSLEGVLILPLNEARGVGELGRWIIRRYERMAVEAHASGMGGARAA